MACFAINRPFSPQGTAARAKVLLLGSSDFHSELMNWARSLHIEHVSPAHLMRREISRPDKLGDEAILALLRRWFFARKPDAGFVLTDFPATLLQAKVLDEWMQGDDREQRETFEVLRRSLDEDRPDGYKLFS